MGIARVPKVLELHRLQDQPIPKNNLGVLNVVEPQTPPNMLRVLITIQRGRRTSQAPGQKEETMLAILKVRDRRRWILINIGIFRGRDILVIPGTVEIRNPRRNLLTLYEAARTPIVIET